MTPYGRLKCSPYRKQTFQTGTTTSGRKFRMLRFSAKPAGAQRQSDARVALDLSISDRRSRTPRYKIRVAPYLGKAIPRWSASPLMEHLFPGYGVARTNAVRGSGLTDQRPRGRRNPA